MALTVCDVRQSRTSRAGRLFFAAGRRPIYRRGCGERLQKTARTGPQEIFGAYGGRLTTREHTQYG